MGLDSVSHSNARRSLRRTYKLLSDKGSVQFNQFNRIFDNTLTNVFAMYTGKWLGDGDTVGLIDLKL